MKKIIRIFFIISLVCFSFFYDRIVFLRSAFQDACGCVGNTISLDLQGSEIATGDPSVVVERVVNDCEVRHIGQASDGQDIEVENDLYAGGVRLVFKYPKKLAGGQVGCRGRI